MNCFKKYGLLVAVVLIMGLVFSSAVFAGNDGPQYLPVHVYYENEDEELVKANYRWAAQNYNESQDARILYNAIVQGVRQALGNFRDVWVEVQNVDDPDDVLYIYYSNALRADDINDLWDAIDDGGYEYTTEPDFAYILEIEDGDPRELPDERQEWLKEDPVIKFETLSNAWMVILNFDFGEEPFDGYGINEWDDFDLDDDDNNIHVRGYFEGDDGSTQPIRAGDRLEVITAEDNGEYKATIYIKDTDHFPSGVETETLVVTYRDVRVTIEGTTYTWYGELEDDDDWWR